jgi:hypothetical protein
MERSADGTAWAGPPFWAGSVVVGSWNTQGLQILAILTLFYHILYLFSSMILDGRRWHEVKK